MSQLETARVGFTCGPRVSKTGAAGAFTNFTKINMTKKHGKSNAANSKDDAHSSNKSDKIIEDEADIYWQIVEIAEDHEMGGVAQEVEDTEDRNIAMIDKKKF